MGKRRKLVDLVDMYKICIKRLRGLLAHVGGRGLTSPGGAL